MVSNVPDPLSAAQAPLALGYWIAAAEAQGVQPRMPCCSLELP